MPDPGVHHAELGVHDGAIWAFTIDRFPHGPLKLTRTELELFLHGSQLVGRVPLMPAPMTVNDLAFGTGS